MPTRLEFNVQTGEATVVPLTAEELAYIAASAPTPEQIEAKRVAAIDAQIVAIEATQARAVREAALGDTTFLLVIEQQIEALRAQR
jgi:hypothetical protein